MLPSNKSIMEYVMELNQVYPKTSRNDVPQTPHIYNNNINIFHSPPPVNHSSSSTDSTSSESFLDMTAFATSFSESFRPYSDSLGHLLDNVISFPDGTISTPDNSISFPDSTISSTDNSISFPNDVASFPGNIMSFSEYGRSFHNNGRSVPDNIKSFRDNGRSVPDNDRSFRDNDRSFRDNDRSFRDNDRFLLDYGKSFCDNDNYFSDSVKSFRDNSYSFHDNVRSFPDNIESFRDNRNSFHDNVRSSPDDVKSFHDIGRAFPDILTPTPDPVHTGRVHRAIIGRKIIENVEPIMDTPKRRHDLVNNSIRHQTDPIFSQRSSKNFDTRTSQKAYELFPADNKNLVFPPPIKSSPSPSTQNSYTSPGITRETFPDTHKSSPPLSNVPIYFPKQVTPSSPSNFDTTSSFNTTVTPTNVCTFCRKNGERPHVYTGHTLKISLCNKTVVACPILRSHVCSICGVTGDNAHTLSYCPVLRDNNNGARLQSTTITLKSTKMKSNGKRRYRF